MVVAVSLEQRGAGLAEPTDGQPPSMKKVEPLIGGGAPSMPAAADSAASGKGGLLPWARGNKPVIMAQETTGGTGSIRTGRANSDAHA